MCPKGCLKGEIFSIDLNHLPVKFLHYYYVPSILVEKKNLPGNLKIGRKKSLLPMFGTVRQIKDVLGWKYEAPTRP